MSTVRLSDAVAQYLAGCVTTESGCLVRPGLDRYGEIKWDGGRTTAHRAVLSAAIGEMPARDVVARHSCDNPPCVNVAHLSFGTQAQNIHETYQRGSRHAGAWQRGEDRPTAILTEDIVRTMRRRVRAGAALSLVAAEAGVSYSTARGAVRGESWQHVTDEPPVDGRRNKAGNPRAYRLTRVDEAAQVLEMTTDGLSLAEIAAALDIARHTAWRLLQVARDPANTHAHPIATWSAA